MSSEFMSLLHCCVSSLPCWWLPASLWWCQLGLVPFHWVGGASSSHGYSQDSLLCCSGELRNHLLMPYILVSQTRSLHRKYSSSAYSGSMGVKYGTDDSFSVYFNDGMTFIVHALYEIITLHSDSQTEFPQCEELHCIIITMAVELFNLPLWCAQINGLCKC